MPTVKDWRPLLIADRYDERREAETLSHYRKRSHHQMEFFLPAPVSDGETTPVRLGAGHYRLGQNDLLSLPSNPVRWEVWVNGRPLAKTFPTKRSAVSFVLHPF